MSRVLDIFDVTIVTGKGPVSREITRKEVEPHSI
jgi:hypothetical protein